METEEKTRFFQQSSSWKSSWHQLIIAEPEGQVASSASFWASRSRLIRIRAYIQQPSFQTNRVLRNVLPRFGVVVAEAVVVEARFHVLVLALVAERAVLHLSGALTGAHSPITVKLSGSVCAPFVVAVRHQRRPLPRLGRVGRADVKVMMRCISRHLGNQPHAHDS